MLSQPWGVCEWVWMKVAGPLGMSHGYFGLFLQVEVLCDYLGNPITSIIIFFFFKKVLRITLKKNVQVQFIFLTARLRVGLQRERLLGTECLNSSFILFLIITTGEKYLLNVIH